MDNPRKNVLITAKPAGNRCHLDPSLRNLSFTPHPGSALSWKQVFFFHEIRCGLFFICSLVYCSLSFSQKSWKVTKKRILDTTVSLGSGGWKASMGLLDSHSPGWLTGSPSATRCWVAWSHYDEQIYSREMGEKEKQNSFCAMERGKTEEVKSVKNGLMWVPCFLLRARVMSKPRLLPWAMSGSTALLQLGLSWHSCFILLPKITRMSWVWAATYARVGVPGLCCCQGHADLIGLCCPLGLWWQPGLSLCQAPCLGT